MWPYGPICSLTAGLLKQLPEDVLFRDPQALTTPPTSAQQAPGIVREMLGWNPVPLTLCPRPAIAHLGTDLFICLTAVLTSKPIPLYPTSKVIDHWNSLQLANEAIFPTVKIQRDPEVQELAQWLAQRHALLGATSVTQGTCHFYTDTGANLSPRPTLVTHSYLHSDRICL